MDDNKLETAEYDSRGRCVRHPNIRLRRKKLLGGWKIIIGHCPECCLDEMRRVRDQIDRQELERNGGGGKQRDDDQEEEDGDGDDMDEEERERRRIRKEKKKKKKSDRHREREHRSGKPRHTADAEESFDPTILGAGGGAPQHTAHHQQDHHYSVQQYHQPPPPPVPKRTMVLSMAFIDPQTGYRGTYTGQVNSLNYKPDGKGTVYYASGSIAEGTWANGILVERENGGGMNVDQGDGGGMASELERTAGPPKIGRGGRGAGGGHGSGPSPSQDLDGHRRIRSSSSQEQRTTGVADGNRAHSLGPTGYHRQQKPGDFTGGNLDKLDRLNRRAKSNRTHGAAASVQSYNSRGSVDVPSGSASVQLDHASAGGRMANLSAGGSLGQGIVGGGGGGGPTGAQYQRNNSGYKPRRPSQNRQGSSPPEYR
jgi:hypothetical protein